MRCESFLKKYRISRIDYLKIEFRYRFSTLQKKLKITLTKAKHRQPADNLLNIAPLHFNFCPAGI